MGIGVVAGVVNHLQPPSANVFTTNNFENYDLKARDPLYGFIFIMPFACHSHVICMRLGFIYMYAYSIRMSLVCTRMLSVCHSYVLPCHPYVTRSWFITRL